MTAAWRNRIVGDGEEAPGDLLANPRNFRRHPQTQQDALRGVLREVGLVQRVIVNRRTGFVVDGHARVEIALRDGQPTIPVLYVDLSDAEEGLVLATLDPISALATHDDAALQALLAEVSTDDPAVQALLDQLAAGLDDATAGSGADADPYTHKITAPTYEPSETCPPVSELFHRAKTSELSERIMRSGVSAAEREFLLLAAERHTVFEFRKIADYYKSIPALSIAIAQGGDFFGGGESNIGKSMSVRRKCMNTFICSTERPFQFFGRINEDVNVYTALGRRGGLFLTVPILAIHQKQTQSNAGGMTDLYLDSGTYVKSFYSVMYAPSCVKVAEMGSAHKRLHHRVKWAHAVPVILDPSRRKPRAEAHQ